MKKEEIKLDKLPEIEGVKKEDLKAFLTYVSALVDDIHERGASIGLSLDVADVFVASSEKGFATSVGNDRIKKTEGPVNLFNLRAKMFLENILDRTDDCTCNECVALKGALTAAVALVNEKIKKETIQKTVMEGLSGVLKEAFENGEGLPKGCTILDGLGGFMGSQGKSDKPN